MPRSSSSWFLAAVAATFSTGALWADVTGSILGVVTDPSSALVQGVRVTATNVDTNLVTEAVTDSNGEYRILSLPAGPYRVQATFPGFQTFIETGIVLTVNEQRRVDIALRIGAAQQEVSVNASAVQVETANTQLGDVIDQKKILELPLNGRSFIDLFGLQPGVAPAGTRNEGPGTVSVNGQRENSNGFLVNGGDVSGAANFEAGVQPNLDAIQEFRLITNSFDAENGRFSGALMNTITKSGTNNIHGAVFEFLRNDAMDARGFFDTDKGALKRNQFGYAVGGPAIKDKLFWFTDFQGDKLVNGGTASAVQVLSSAERQGDVGVENLTSNVTGSYWAQVLSQRLGRPVQSGEPYATVFPDGIIPTSAFSSATKGTIGFIPTANVGDNTYSSAAISTHSSDYKAGQRVDFLNKLTGNWTGYYYFDDYSQLDPYGASSFPTGFGSEARNRNQLFTLSNTYVVNPTAVNDFRLSYTRIVVRSVPAGSVPPSLESMGFITGPGTLGINNSGPTGYQAVPDISLNNFSFGDPGTNNAIQNTYQVGDNFSKVTGRHTLKFGGEMRYYQMNNRNGGGFVGQFNFSGGETGSDVADYLLGAPSSYSQASPQVLDGRSRYAGAFAQDSFRIRSNLTLNYGLRWEFSTPWWDTQNKIVALVPGEQSVQYPKAPKGLVYPGDPGIPKTLAPTRYNNFGPRVGIAYSPAISDGFLGKLFGGPGKTSIRASWGMFYTAIQDQTLYWILGTVPFGEYWGSPAPSFFEEPFRTRATGESQGQPFPYVIPTPGTPAANNFDFSPYLPLVSTLGYEIHNKLPYAMHQNFTVQRQLGNSTVLSVGYVGTLGRHMLSIVEANPADSALCLSLRGSGVMAGTLECGKFLEDQTFTRPDGSQVFGTRPILGSENFGFSYYESNWANSDYNSLQTSLKGTTGNSSFLFGYTWSKSLDNGSFFNDRMNYANHALSRSLSNFDVTHNFVASYTYAIPFDRAFPGLPKRLTQGWEIAGITRFSTGFPIGVIGDFDQSLRGTQGLDPPDFFGPLQLAGDPRTNGHLWMTTSGFGLPALGNFGTANRRFFHGPGLDNWNLALHKDTVIRENMTLQIRAEFFNAFNHAQFANPNGLFSGSTFGLITSVQAPPRIGQVAAKFIF
ncbi:MAG TPA: carboxypeptidase regulatory-like domain-containing protein [Bryobacteraceae bacterium]